MDASIGATYIAAHALGVRAGIAELAPAVLGLDPRRVERVGDAMDATLTGHAHAKSPIDVACWDLLGTSTGLPVCELLGGRTEVRLPLVSSVPAGDPEDMRARVAHYRGLGYLGHSVKVGDDPALDAARIEAALADRRPGEYFLVDANGGMTVEHALRMLRLLPSGLDFVFDELATDLPSIIQLVADDAADGIGLKIAKVGGLTSGRRQRDVCVGAAALVHLGQTVPERYLRCILESREMVTTTTVVTPRLDVLGEPVATYA